MILFRSISATFWAGLAALPATAPVAAQSRLGRIEVGRPFPEMRFAGLTGGDPTSLADFRGKRVLLLVFASW